MEDFVSNKKFSVPQKAFSTIKSYYKLHPTWSFKNSDQNISKWDFISNADSHILNELKSYEGMTWGEIMKAIGGRKSGTNNHPVNIRNLSSEAQSEIKNIKSLSNELQLIFSLRITAKTRLYGIIDEESGLYKIIWLDKKHEIYPIKK